jgi:hypothetical protein
MRARRGVGFGLVAAGALVLFAAHCSELTEVYIVVDSDLDVARHADRIVVTIDDPNGGPVTRRARLADSPLPATLAVQAGSNDSATVTVTARAEAAGTSILETKVRTQFTPGSSRVLTITLCAACIDVTCVPGRCDQGACVADEVPATSLPTYRGAPGRTACPPGPPGPGDAGPQDAGTDGPDIPPLSTGHVYVVGGADSNDKVVDDVLFAQIQSDGLIGPWNPLPNAPQKFYLASRAQFRDELVVVGGTAEAGAVYAAAHLPDAALSTWALQPGTQGTATFGIATAVSNGFAYAIGGGNPESASAQWSPITANGITGPWKTTASLLMPRSIAGAAVAQSCVFVTGGLTYGPFTPHTEVYHAPINADGTLGAFTATVGLPAPRWGHTLLAYNAHLLVLGGNDGTAPTDTILVADVNGDCTVGAWTPATIGLPWKADSLGAFIYNDSLYVVGGHIGVAPNAATPRTAVAKLALDGSTSTFREGAQISAGGRYGHVTAVFDDPP